VARHSLPHPTRIVRADGLFPELEGNKPADRIVVMKAWRLKEPLMTTADGICSTPGQGVVCRPVA
jgi:hypothetical protein